MIWTVPPIWEGGDVWILGGGPSVPKQFGIPDEVVHDVIHGILPPSAYSPYMEPLHKCHVIGINVAFLIGDWIDMVFFGDSKFFHQYKEKLARFPGMRVTCNPGLKGIPWVKWLARDIRHSFGIGSTPDMVSWNSNSGAAAISVAAHAGAKRIILLGFDMKQGVDKSKHWHRLYQPIITPAEAKRKGVILHQRMPFDRHLKCFPTIAKEAAERGIEILNASPDSAITVFPKYSVKELLWDNN